METGGWEKRGAGKATEPNKKTTSTVSEARLFSFFVQQAKKSLLFCSSFSVQQAKKASCYILSFSVKQAKAFCFLILVVAPPPPSPPIIIPLYYKYSTTTNQNQNSFLPSPLNLHLNIFSLIISSSFSSTPSHHMMFSTQRWRLKVLGGAGTGSGQKYPMPQPSAPPPLSPAHPTSSSSITMSRCM